MADARETMSARIFTRAAFPVMKVALQDDPGLKQAFADVRAKVLFIAKDETEPVAATLVFDAGEFRVEQGVCDKPDITFAFRSLKKMNDLLRGRMVLPSITGWTRVGLLVKVLRLLLSLKIMMPNARPKQEEKQRLKVKMIFYTITTALSQYNKGGDPEMVKWTSHQPDRIYQLSVEPEGIAAYLRVKAGKTKAGRGYYTRRRPFLHMKFHTAQGALAVLLRDAAFVEAVGKGFVEVEGSPEYATQVNDFMMKIQGMIT